MTTTITEPPNEADYHTHRALSYSTGKQLLRSPMHYLHAIANRKTSTAFDVGHAVHALVLGVGEEIVEIPAELLSDDGGVRSNKAKAWRDQARADGKTPIKPSEMEPIKAAAEAVLAHPTARAWLEREGEVELPLFATDPETGIDIRGKIDKLATLKKVRVPVDLKTVDDAREGSVFRAIRSWDYDLQAAMYRKLITLAMGCPSGPGVLIAAETDPPYGVAVYQLSHEDFVAAGDLKLRTVLARAKALRDNPDAWTGYPLGTHVLTPPSYYLTDLEERFAS